MKECPNCGSHIVVIVNEDQRLLMKWVACEICHMEGPHYPSSAPAVEDWDALPRRLDVPKNSDLALLVEGIDYGISWTHIGAATLCAVTWEDKGKRYGTAGFAKCHPKDAYSQAVGDKVAIRNACGVGEWRVYDLGAVYRAYRLRLREHKLAAEVAAATANGAEPLKA